MQDVTTAKAPQGTRNAALREAMRAYVQDALDLLDECVAAGDQVPDVETDAWARRGGVFVRERHVVALWETLVAGSRPSLEVMSSTKACREALRRDPQVARQLNALVGMGLDLRRISEGDILEGMVSRLAHAKGGYRFDGALFEAEYAALEEALYSPVVPFEALAPLRGFRSEAPDLPLGPGLRVEALTDADIVDCIRAGQLIVGEGFVVDPPRFGIKARYDVPKSLGDAPAAPGQAGHVHAQERLEEVMRALAVFKPGRCARAAVVHRSPQWFLRGTVSATPGDPGVAWGRTYALSKAEAATVPRFWTVLQSPQVKARRSLAVALRRFHDATGRTRPEDRLIDLLITAEALALNVPNDSSDPGEMAYRLALRAGSSLAEQQERRAFDRHIRQAYLVRNAVVHGREPELPPAAPGAEAPTLDGFIDETERLLREALQRAVALAAVPGLDTRALDWAAVEAAVAC